MEARDDFSAWGWFGQSYDAPIEKVWPKIETPVGQKCSWCPETIKEGDDGFRLPLIGGDEPSSFYHRACFRETLGI